LTDHLVKQFKQQIEELALLPSDGGRFEVSIDDELVYSKLESGEFPDNRSIEKAVRERL
jgi:selenoprotein W-related protein